MDHSMDHSFRGRGWVELDGERLLWDEVEAILRQEPERVSDFGGEFFLEWNNCRARDHFGIMPGASPSGFFICGDEKTEIIGQMRPGGPLMDLDVAITTSVGLRGDEGVVALSGGVDSALVAALSGRECVVVGVRGSHDTGHAGKVACSLGLFLHEVLIEPDEIEMALRAVLAVIPERDPVNASIATTLYFVCRWAGEHGVERILAGQGADELFGGYSRYLQSEDLASDMQRDLLRLPLQLQRDQAVAGLFGAYFSLPYMDTRVVAAAQAVPVAMRIKDGVRKWALREVASRHMPVEIAMHEKKAMQYGSGVMREIERLASRRGYKRAISRFIDEIAREEGLV